MLSKVFSSGSLGIESYKVEVEVDVGNGLPIFNIVGMADIAISESRERVRAALKNCKFDMSPKRIIVNLSPAGIKKEGPQFDLPIAIGIMRAMGHITKEDRLEEYMYIGELSLGGKIRRTKGIINAVICAKEMGMKGIIIPKENYWEASTIEGIEVLPVADIKEVYDFIENAFLKRNARVLMQSATSTCPSVLESPRRKQLDCPTVVAGHSTRLMAMSNANRIGRWNGFVWFIVALSYMEGALSRNESPVLQSDAPSPVTAAAKPHA